MKYKDNDAPLPPGPLDPNSEASAKTARDARSQRAPERVQAIALANKVLDTHWRDPDDDLSTLARHLLRSEEREEALRDSLRMCMHALRSYQFGNGAPDLAEQAADHASDLLSRVSPKAREQSR